MWRQSWWVHLAVATGVASCSTSNDVAYCGSDTDCGDGLVCGTTDCTGITTCIRAECACTPGGFRNPCSSSSTTTTCTCAGATCEQPLDSCGEAACPGVCELGDSCQFCLEGDGCGLVEPCRESRCVVGPTGQAACRPEECLDPRIEPPLCGSADAPCGPACPEPDCAGKECGEDPLTGLSCGECGPHRYCILNECRQDAGYTLCDGDLVAMPEEIPIQQLSGTMPEPEGGTIADGIYDLVEQHEYRQYSTADKYDRGALRFAAGATQVEHIYDPEPGSADPESPHRQMTMTAEGTTLSFQVDCPLGPRVLFPMYTRGYTANGDTLWLFQREFIEIYARRP